MRHTPRPAASLRSRQARHLAPHQPPPHPPGNVRSDRLRRYLARRLLGLPVTLLGVSVLTFLFLRLIPGDVIAVRLGTSTALSPDQLAQLRGYFGLDRPLHVQYLTWLG